MFKIGDKVVHPAHGAGVVAGIEQRDIVDDFDRYYVIDLAAQTMRLMVPVRMADDLGLRLVASAEGTREVLDVLAAVPDVLPDDFKARQTDLQVRMRVGSAVAVAEVVRDMASRLRHRPCSPTETRLYQQARTMLGGELALAQGTDLDEALTQIDGLVDRALSAAGRD